MEVNNGESEWETEERKLSKLEQIQMSPFHCVYKNNIEIEHMPGLFSSLYNSIIHGGIFCPNVRLTLNGFDKFAIFAASVNITSALIFFTVLSVMVVASLD